MKFITDKTPIDEIVLLQTPHSSIFHVAAAAIVADKNFLIVNKLNRYKDHECNNYGFPSVLFKALSLVFPNLV